MIYSGVDELYYRVRYGEVVLVLSIILELQRDLYPMRETRSVWQSNYI